MRTIEEIADKVGSLRERLADRDNRMRDITSIRKGDMERVAPDMFPEGMSKPMIANFIDVAARDIAEVLAPLPSFNCSSLNINSDDAKKKADKRTMIANNYVQFSGLQSQMYTGADWFITYGFLPVVVEPDPEEDMPRIRVENPLGAYPEFDGYGRCVSYSKVYIKTIRELINEFPIAESVLLGRMGREQDVNATLELIKYQDKDAITLYLPERSNYILKRIENPIKKMLVTIVRRPGIDLDDPRGQFDDVMWAQVARARFSFLAMDAAEKSVYAPLALPPDVQEVSLGADAIIRTQNPQGIRRIGLELPTAAFTEQQLLESELRMGSRYPEGRSGQIDASIVTGSGVQALLGGFDSQIKASQQMFTEVFEKVISICFEMDDKFFPNIKSMRGVYQGAPYKLDYTPSRDIAGDYTIQVRYGLMAGLDPSRALIFSLQALQAGLISRDFVMRELPWSINASLEQDRMEIERLRDALSSSIMSLTQAIPQMAASGGDPSEIVEKIAKVIELKQKGSEIEDAVGKIFKKPESAPQAAPVEGAPGMQPPMNPAQPVEQTPPGANPQQQAPADVASILAQMGR